MTYSVNRCGNLMKLSMTMMTMQCGKSLTHYPWLGDQHPGSPELAAQWVCQTLEVSQVNPQNGKL